MIIEIVDKDHARALDTFTAIHPNGHFMQTSFWAKVKHDWKWFGVICRNTNGNITGTMGVLLRRISNLPFHMMYAPRGPVCDLNDAETFRALIDAARKEGEKYHAYELKIDKDVPVENDAYRTMVTSLGFRLKQRTLDLDDFQCRFVFRIMINNRTEEEVLNSFHAKHRYNIRVAQKHNVEVRVCGSEQAECFYQIMQVTGERDHFAIRSAAYFARILDVFGDNARLYIAYYEGQAIAGSLAVRWGNKVWYFYGASLNEHRNVMPNYLLQWEMIRWTIASKCDIYDFRGVSGNMDKSRQIYGLYRFKKGFSGDFVEFMGEMDLVIKPAAAKAIAALQRIVKRIK